MGEKDPLYGLGDPLPPLNDLFLDRKKPAKSSDPLGDLFSDPTLKKTTTTDSDEFDKSGTEGTEDDEDWMSSAPPLDYLERVKVRLFHNSISCTVLFLQTLIAKSIILFPVFVVHTRTHKTVFIEKKCKG